MVQVKLVKELDLDRRHGRLRPAIRHIQRIGRRREIDARCGTVGGSWHRRPWHAILLLRLRAMEHSRLKKAAVPLLRLHGGDQTKDSGKKWWHACLSVCHDDRLLMARMSAMILPLAEMMA